MATRNVFKFFGSIGPAGSIVSLTEKLCSSLYPHAYKFGDESQVESQIDKDLRSVREDYIKALFDMKNKFQKKIDAKATAQDKQDAYKKLIDIIQNFISKTVRLEKNKYMRERIFYQREAQMVMYEEANKAYNNCENEVKDNLVKQAKTICNPSKDDFDKYFSQFGVNYHDQTSKEIADQIPKTMAQGFFDVYSKIRAKLQQDIDETNVKKSNNSASAEEINFLTRVDSPEDQDQYVKDRLFVDTGEDVEDIFLAFKFHKLM